MKTFWIRTASAAVYALLFLGSIYSGRMLGNSFWGVVVLTTFALFVAMGCTFEYFRIASKQNYHPNRGLGYFFTALMTVIIGLSVAFALPEANIDYDEYWAPFACVGGFFILCEVGIMVLVAIPVTLVTELWRNSEHPFADVLHTLLPMLYCAVPLGLMPYLHCSTNVLVMCIILVWVNDSFAYMGGSLLGRHKMWPKHSPGKTWEGTAIGVEACLLTAIFVGPLFQTKLGIGGWICIGLICSVLGTLGDLVESMLKRSAGLKDSGNIMPGHGGFLDRFDSLLMIIPPATLVAGIITEIAIRR